MYKFLVALVLLLLCVNTVFSSTGDDEFTLAGSWWQGPAVKARHSCFVATFDSATCNDADFARGDNRCGGFGMTPDVPGKYGQATCIDEMGGHLHFKADRNFDADKGTIRMLVKGDIWNSKKQCWLFEARGGYHRIGILCHENSLALMIHGQYRRLLGKVKLSSLGEVDPDKWHQIIASWDRSRGKGWISLDGKGRNNEMKFSPTPNELLVFYIAGGYEARRHGRNEPGLSIDEVVIYDASLPELQFKPKPVSGIDEELLPKVEAGARKGLGFLADLQCYGGWASGYTWPTMINGSGRRQFVNFDGAVWTESQTTPLIASRYIYAYNIMGDYSFLQAVRKAGTLFVEVQDPWGSWRAGYHMTAKGMVPRPSKHINIQEVQRAPNFLLSYLYLKTGDETYLDAVKKSGEFHLDIQNPNGSWSHHWSPTKKNCETFRGKPQGGELNDNCTNDCIDTLALIYHLTSDKRYTDSLKRVGQWLLDAQLDGPMYGWADCYDKDNNPEWAREFEPPSYSCRATRDACRALIEIYRLSGDEKYLESVRACLKWLKKDYPDGMYFYYDYKTARPITSWQYKIVYLDEPESFEWIRKQPLSDNYYRKHVIIPDIEKFLADAERPAHRLPKVDIEEVRKSLPQLRQAALEALAEQNEHGCWVSKTSQSYDVGIGFSTTMPQILDLLRYIEAVKRLNGELPLKYNGDGDHTGPLAWSQDNWYDVGW